MFTILIPVAHPWSELHRLLVSIERFMNFDVKIILGIEPIIPFGIDQIIHFSEGVRERNSNVTYQIICHDSVMGAGLNISNISKYVENDFVITLDADVEWVQPLPETVMERFNNSTSIGAICPLLVYSGSGGIQHAGIVFSNTTIHHLYLNANPEAIRQDCQVQSGIFAFSIFPRKIFDSFRIDENYFNGYEDIDFFLQMNQMGLKTIICHDFWAFHRESKISAYRDSMRRGNLGYFWQKWNNFISRDMYEYVKNSVFNAMAHSLLKWDVFINACDNQIVGREIINIISSYSSNPKFYNCHGIDLYSMNFIHEFCSDETGFVVVIRNFVQIIDNYSWFYANKNFLHRILVVDISANVISLHDLFTCCWPGRHIR